MIERIAVLGGGAWGTALALTAARAGRDVVLWARDGATAAAINQRSENPRHLPGVALAPPLRAIDSLSGVGRPDAIVLAVPAQEIRNVATMLSGQLTRDTPIVISAKGIERDTGKRLSEVVADVAPAAQIAVLSGPSFALDVARALPTAVTIAARDEQLALSLCTAFGSASFRPYAETDVIGVEIGGAVKNVLAIAAGVVAGAGLGSSAQAALVARGFAELRRFGAAHGARAETLMGLSGLGDLVLTCSSSQSRNFSYGRTIGEQGAPPRAPHALVEGIATATIVRDISAKQRIAMPITDAVAAVLDGSISVADAVENLMNRPLKAETDASPAPAGE